MKERRHEMKEIVIDISDDGEIRIETRGFQGKELSHRIRVSEECARQGNSAVR